MEKLFNLTGKIPLYSGEIPIDFNIEGDIESLKMRLEIDDIYIYVSDKKSSLFPPRSYIEAKEMIFSQGSFSIPSIEGLHLTVSRKNDTTKPLPPTKVIKKNLLPLLDDEEILDFSIRQKDYFMAVFKTFDSSNRFNIDKSDREILFYLSKESGENLYNSFLEAGFITNWDIDKKILTIDFIYSEGFVDPSKLATLAYTILSGRKISENLLKVIFD